MTNVLMGKNTPIGAWGHCSMKILKIKEKHNVSSKLFL